MYQLFRVISGEDRLVGPTAALPAMCEVLPGERVRIDRDATRYLSIDCDHLGRPQFTGEQIGVRLLVEYDVGAIPKRFVVYAPDDGRLGYALVAEGTVLDDLRLFIKVHTEPIR